MQPRPALALLGGVIVAAALAGCGGASVSSSAVVHSASTSSSASASSTASVSSTSSVQTPSAARPASICTERGVAAVEGALRVGAGAVRVRAQTANSSYPECVFEVRLAGGRRVALSVEVDTEPDAYADLERAIVENGQDFSGHLSATPVHVAGLGLDASWFPLQTKLETTDAQRLIIATIIDWPHASTHDQVRLTAAAARGYLGADRPRLAKGPAPSG